MIKLLRLSALVGALAFVAVAVFSHDPATDLRIAANAFRAGDLDSALRLARMAGLLSDGKSREWGRSMELEARAALGLDRPDQAAKILDKLLKVQPDHVGGLQLRGEMRLAAGDAAGALKDLNQSQEIGGQEQTKLSKSQAPHLARRGQAFFKAGNLAAAQKDAETAFGLDPAHPEVLYLMSLVLESKGRLKPALEMMEKAAQAAHRADHRFINSDKGKEWIYRLIELRAKAKEPLVGTGGQD